MPASPLDSSLYGNLFGDHAVSELFTESAEIRAMLRVEGALARAQGALGLIPADAADFIFRAAQNVVIDPAALAVETAQNGVPVPGLLAAFRRAVQAHEPLQYLHYGATSQDIMDTALALRLQDLFQIWDARLSALLIRLAVLAETHAELPMAARTYGQFATPTSFGAVVANWGWPLVATRERLPPLRTELSKVSLSGAAGTLSVMGEVGPAVRAALAQELGLSDPGHSWHSDRSSLAQLAAFAAGLAGTLGKLGEDVILLCQSGVAEVGLGGMGGSSSTMPQKQNPVGPSVLVALARHTIGLASLVQGAAIHRQQRDGAAWFAEWLALPQLCICAGRMLTLADEIVVGIVPDGSAMANGLEAACGLLYAEGLSFALAEQMPRPQAQDIVKSMCKEATATGTHLFTLASQRFPQADWHRIIRERSLGQSPVEAREFARRARSG